MRTIESMTIGKQSQDLDILGYLDNLTTCETSASATVGK